MVRLDFSFFHVCFLIGVIYPFPPLTLIVLCNFLMVLGKYLTEHGEREHVWLTVNGSISRDYGTVCSHLSGSGSRKWNQDIRL